MDTVDGDISFGSMFADARRNEEVAVALLNLNLNLGLLLIFCQMFVAMSL